MQFLGWFGIKIWHENLFLSCFNYFFTFFLNNSKNGIEIVFQLHLKGIWSPLSPLRLKAVMSAHFLSIFLSKVHMTSEKFKKITKTLINTPQSKSKSTKNWCKLMTVFNKEQGHFVNWFERLIPPTFLCPPEKNQCKPNDCV